MGMKQIENMSELHSLQVSLQDPITYFCIKQVPSALALQDAIKHVILFLF